MSGAGGLIGALGIQAMRYVLGPTLDSKQKAALLARNDELLAAQERLAQLKLERINHDRIPLAKLDDLVEESGELFTDYFLQPAVLYRTGENSCVARSAVCTHLGCTVQTELVDGKIYCPCHVSYFDLKTGNPLVGPAVYPLAEEPIVIDGDTVYLVKPTAPIRIGPAQNPMTPV